MILKKEQYAPNPKWHKQDELPVFQKVRLAFKRYFNGEVERFSEIPLKPEGTAFQQAIWQALREIAYGELSSYGELALRINNPKAVRAVGGGVAALSPHFRQRSDFNWFWWWLRGKTFFYYS
ncbi:hypothetical protein CHBNV1_06700 [Haemophilus influenzae]|nr:hypothetical protein CHBNV1_06700 [Haemophilus influenzae]